MSDPAEPSLRPHLSPLGAWAFSIGTSIGWGSLVITGNTYLSQAGPLGSALGLVIGALIMLVISRNYHYLLNCTPEAGGVYTYVRNAYGFDHGFLISWFLLLTYLAIFWANATSLPLFARFFLGDVFEFGPLYNLFGYDVYLGEALLSIAAIAGIGLVCVGNVKMIARLMIALAVLFALGITFCFAAALFRLDVPLSPAFVPDNSALSQILRIACISPWAFVGFESISHAAEDFSFPHKKTFRVLLVSVVTVTLLYVFTTLLSASAYPPEYDSWLAYIRDLDNLEGIKGLPAFYAARHYLGDAGILILGLSLLALIMTSLIGNINALSRLLLALGRDRILPARFARVNKNGVPSKAIWLVVGVSLLVPFVGRTAIGWIVDVTTIGATLIYGFVSASAYKTARLCNDKTEQWTGLIGLIVMLAFGAYLLVPNLFTVGTIETESYFLFVVWAMLGFVFFRTILRRDQSKRFGKSIIVWIAFLSLILFVSLVWMSQSMMRETASAMRSVQEYYAQEGFTGDASAFIARELTDIRYASARSIIVVVALFGLSLGVLLNNYSVLSRQAQAHERELGTVRDQANRDPLTGVKSKHAFAEAEREINTRIDEGGMEDFSVVVCDVNGLKHINDTYGHKAGDEYICRACRMICDCFQHSPVYRVGGDEFVVLLKGRDHGNRYDLVSQLDTQVEANIGTDGAVISAGISDFIPEEDRSVHAVFDRADQLMYQRKKQLKAMGAVTR